MRSEPSPTFARGADIIRAAAKEMPLKPGVYRMFDAKDQVLYVGKARQLPKRVTNYTSISGLSNRIMTMVTNTVRMEFTVTATEAEALLLEANLIKKLKPRYNILLRDDKSFPYILLREDHPYPQITKHRGKRSIKGKYFGPFASAGAVNKTIDVLQRAFLLRPCSDSIFKNRSRPCLQYQIKRCSAPCVDYISPIDYVELIDEAYDFLRGKSRAIQERLVERMQSYSEAMEFEKAAQLRDRIGALTTVQQQQGYYAANLEDADVIALALDKGEACVKVMFFRGGQFFGEHYYHPKQAYDASAAEVMSAFISQFYQTHDPAKEIIVGVEPESSDALEEALSLQLTSKVTLHHPQRGDKRALIAKAEKEAMRALTERVNANLSEKSHLKNVAKTFGLAATPSRIEVYDNSHIAGQYAVGAMIVAGAEGLMKDQYRIFNIRHSDMGGEDDTKAKNTNADIIAIDKNDHTASNNSQNSVQQYSAGDDFGMMREVFTRRFARLQKEDPDKSGGMWPDLVIIDGGAGQLSAAMTILEELGVSDVPLVSMAKGPDRNAGREDFYQPHKAPFKLPKGDATLHYLQRLRDESHRFAIGSHRVRRAKSVSVSLLDDIPGIGARRKKALLHHFGSAKSVQRASLAELANVEGLNQKIARIIYDYFHER